MAYATRKLADEGWRPKGTLIYLAVADEEALGTWGAHWLVEHEPEAVKAEYVLTENGGFRLPFGDPSIPLGPQLDQIHASAFRSRYGPRPATAVP